VERAVALTLPRWYVIVGVSGTINKERITWFMSYEFIIRFRGGFRPC
jgi:hypothetical protein